MAPIAFAPALERDGAALAYPINCVLHAHIHGDFLMTTHEMNSDFLRLANILATVSQAVQARLDQGLKRHPNQTSSSLAALNVIGMYEGCSNTELSQAIGLSHTATVRLVDKLEGQDLIISRQGVDRRSVHFALTEAGRLYTRDLLLGRCVAAGSVVRLLSASEQKRLSELLEKLLAQLAERPVPGGDLCRLCDQIACPPDRCPAHTHINH